METLECKFRAKEFYLLLRLLESCRPKIAAFFLDIDKLNAEEKENTAFKIDKIDKILGGILNIVMESQELLNDLLASSLNKQKQEIEDLDMVEYLKTIKGFIYAVKWEDIMGELKGLLPTDLMKKAKEYLSQVKENIDQEMKEQT